MSIARLESDWRPAALTGDDVEKGGLVGRGFHVSPPPPPCVAEADAEPPPPAPPDAVAVAVAGDEAKEDPEMAETNDPDTVEPPTAPAPTQPQTSSS